MRSLQTLGLCFVSFLALPNCSSQKDKPSPHQSTGWDYQKIRDNRDAEDAQAASLPAPDLEAEARCQVMTRSEMRRAKLSGCRPLDPRLGHGPDAFCCPKP